MIKLQCTKCGKVWYTAYVQGEQICSDCNGPLVEVEYDNIKQNIEEEENDKKSSFLNFFKRNKKY